MVAVHPMDRSSLGRLLRLAAAMELLAASGCGVSTKGLGPTPDSSAGGAEWCPPGLTDQASWPAKTSYTTCSRACGPDSLGLETCSQTDRASCQAKSGCVCLQAPCVQCMSCGFQRLPDCYVPTNAATATLCANGVTQGAACSPPCGQLLCLEKDGKTGCLCNGDGRFACADWSGSAWQ